MKKLILIDLSSIAHPIWHTSGQDANVDATSQRTVERVRALASNEPNVAVCCDAGKSFRHTIDPDYKGNRPPAEAALHHQIDVAIDTLRHDGFPVWRVPGFEADDVIASAAWNACQRQGVGFVEQVIVHSSDKDLLQLVSERVSVWSLTSGAQYDPAAVVAKFGITPNQFVDYLSLVGDAADNIKGAKGIGAKKAAELLKKYGNLEDLYAALTNQGTQFTPGLATALREFEPRMKQVRQLVTLITDVAIPFDEVLRERVAEDAVFADDEAEGSAAVEEMREAMHGATSGAASQPGDVPAAPVATPGPSHPASVAAAPAPVAVPTQSAAAAPASPSSTSKPADVKTPEVMPPPTQRPRNDIGQMLPGPAPMALRDEGAPAPIEWERQLEPRSYGQVKALATDFFASRLFAGYGNAPAVMATIMAGRELGMTAAASLRGFDIIDGKPSMKADLIRALILRSGKAEYFRCTERSDVAATFKTKRIGDDEPIALRFTIEDGRKAFQGDEAKWAKSGWGKNPADMLVARAGAKLARLVYPDVVHGLYSPEELEGDR